MKHRAPITVSLIILAVAATLRLAWLTADPPTQPAVGVVWHDEGAWVHNARNRALWGEWRTDAWNPLFVAPVFTALEYGAFSAFGVGTWQARTVPAASGLAAIVLLAAGLAAAGGRRAALIGGTLLATNYVFVMWNRAALMESTMTAFIVASWAAYAMAEHRPRLGLLAGTFVVLAWFTKAAAAAVIVALFVLPNWSEYQFYNWQMSVTRKPAYTVKALMDRASWLPIIHDYFTRMWLVVTLAALAVITIVLRWRTARPSERLLVLWVMLGIAELVVHDAGNERRYVMFIPAFVGLAALVLGRQGPAAPPVIDSGPSSRWIVTPFVFLFAYLIMGSLLRLAELGEVGRAVRLSAAVAAALSLLLLWRWGSVRQWLSRQQVTAGAAAALTAIAVTGDLVQYWQWARTKTFENYQASVMLGQHLAPGTLVHGKLANGLSLENRIRPIFVGRGFGNYEDRKTRDDVRYILTYIAPSLGYESQRQNPVIQDVLDAYPNRSIIMTFDVAETATGHDRAALIDKFGAAASTKGQTTGRATH